jgi:hypothetical protein
MSPDTSLHPSKPFLIEIRQDRPRPNGSFTPASSLKITEELRTSGLLHSLSPEEAKHLLFLLTFVSPEGHCHASLPMLTSAMRVTSAKARARMHRLAEFRWRGEPVVIEVPHGGDLVSYGLHPHRVAYEHLTISEPHATSPLRAGSRQAVIAYSRKHYARPRAEVEKIIAEQLGHDPEETPEQRQLRFRLENVGLAGEQIGALLAAFPVEVIARQLDWLPYRHAKNPAGYLIAAIEGGYDEPHAVREQRLLQEEQIEAQTAKSESLPDVPTEPESQSLDPIEIADLDSGETINLMPEE